GVGLTLTDLTRLYAAIARGGRPVTLSATHPAAPPAEQVLSPAAAWQVADILAGTPPPATASPPVAIAYKTGTSFGYRDAWALGFDGRHVVGVWLGRPDGAPVPGQTGMSAAAPLLFDVFARLPGGAVPLPP